MTRRIKVWPQVFSDRSTIQLQWIDHDGHRRTKTSGTADPVEAEAVRVDLEAALNDGRYRSPSRTSWSTFREAFEREHVAGLRPASQDKFANCFGHFETLCRPTTLGGISQRTISQFAAALRTPCPAASTVKVVLAYLHAALAWGRKQGFLAEVPVFPAVKVPKKRPQPVAAELVDRLLAVCDDVWRAFLLCAWLAGLRRNEALALSWDAQERVPWVDLDRNRIWLPAGFVKGQEDQWVPLDPQLRIALEKTQSATPLEGNCVFDFHTSPPGVSGLVRTLARRAGVRLTMRVLRRGFVCRYAAKVPAQVLQKLARHADFRTTLEFYAAIDEAAEAAVLQGVTGL